ncbi:MAG: DMT family transporter [Proteobacteria bacterium]|nr:DMT family transporter [Pseudomonadota bacterium]
MFKLILAVVTVVSGAGLAAQAIVNSQLRSLVGSGLVAAVTNNFVGLCALFFFLLISGQATSLANLTQVPSTYLIGGLFGAVFVFVSTYAAKELGMLFFLALVVSGQFVLASLIDHFGWFGAEQQAFTIKRALGVIALIAGAILVKLK